MIKTVAYALFERRDPAASRSFYEQFGLTVVEDREDRVLFRGAEGRPVIFGLIQGESDRLARMGYELRSEADLERAAERFGVPAVPVEDMPGGGRRVEIEDCDGNRLDLLWGVEPVAELSLGREEVDLNTATNTRRKGRFPIFEDGPVPVLHVCHVIHCSNDPKRFADWYVENLGAYVSDVIEMPNGVPAIAFLRFPNGKEFVDHHNAGVALGEPNAVQHICFEVQDMDALFMGHRHLHAIHAQNDWGPLRHSVGGAVSDYWFDPVRLRVEHVTDSDVVNDEYPTQILPLSDKAAFQWAGQPMPEDFGRS